MCEVCTNSKNLVVNARRYDPTRTTTLRNSMVRNMNRRFETIIRLIRKAIVEEDVFGLEKVEIFQETPGTKAYQFKTLAEKVQEFMNWLQEQVDNDILSVGRLSREGYTGVSEWMNLYIYDTYKRAVMRGREEMIRAGYNIPPIAAVGGIEAILATPYHAEILGMLYTRAFNELKGVTDAMAQQISRVLTQGLADGDNPLRIARKLVAVINGKGIGDLGITDSLGRFIPAKRRAEILARTEIIHAYHQAAMREYEQWQVEGLKVIAEFITAGDERVCPICSSLEGNTYTLEEAKNLIPVHPQCRCVVVPIVKGGN